MEILWKTHDIPIEKAITTLDEIVNAVGIQGARAVNMSTDELKESLKEWGTQKETKVIEEPKPVKLTPKQKQSREKMKRFQAERQKRTDERDEKEVHDEPIYPEEKDKPEWKKRGRPENPVEALDWEKKIRRKKVTRKKPEERMIGGKKTKVTPMLHHRNAPVNPQSGPVTEPQKLPQNKWVYLDEEEDTMGKSYQEILKATSQRRKFIESIKDLPPQERKEKMAEFHTRYKQTQPPIKGKKGKPMIFWIRREMKKPSGGKARGGRMLGHKMPALKLKDPVFMIEALNEIKTKQNSKQIDILIKIIQGKKTKETRFTGKNPDPYTITGKPKTKEIRQYNEQELVLDKLLELLEKGYNYKSRVDLQREVKEQKLLSSKFLSLLSQDLFGETKNIHPRLTDKLKKASTFNAFREFLTSQGKNLPRETSFRGALRSLEGRKGMRSRIIEVMLTRPDDYVYREDIYDEHLKIINGFIKKNIKALSNSLRPLVKGGLIGEWDEVLSDIKSDYDKLNAEKKKRITLDEFEGKKLVNIIKEILDDVKDLNSSQRAKIALLEIGQSNGKSGTANNTEYDTIMENFNLLRQSYHWGKYINEAQTKAGINLTDEGIPIEPDTPSKPKPESESTPKSTYSAKQKQLYKHYKDYKKSIWDSRQNIKQLKKEIREEDTEMIHQWNEAQREKDSKYVSNLDNLKRRLRKEQGIVDRMVRSLETMEEKYPDLLQEVKE